MLGVEFKKDFDAKYFQKKLFENGFIAAIAGNNTLRFLPPYIITKKHIDELISELDKIISL